VFPLEHFRFLIENYSLFLYFLQLLIVQLLIQYNSLLVNAGKEIHELMDCFISSGLECASGPSIHTFMLRLLCTSLSNGKFLITGSFYSCRLFSFEMERKLLSFSL
jgi:hypothetical protein